MVVSRALAGYSVRSGLAVTQRAAGANMSVDVAAGAYLLNNVPGTYAATTNVAVDAADSTNPRLDILYINSSGVLTIAKGTAAAIFPAGETNYKKFEVPYPADLSGTAGIPLAIIHVGAGVSTITDANIWMIGSISELGYLEKLITDTIAKGAPRAQDTPDMTIYVPAFVAYVNGALVSFPGGNSAAMVAPTANPRIDRVYLTDAGALAISTGAEDASPTAPALVANTVPICLVYHRVGSVHIDDADDGTNSYIYRDDRPLFGGVSTPAAILDTILTTRGDLLYRPDGTSARLAKGAANTVLAMGDSDPAWSTVSSLLDSVLGSTEGMVAKRGAATWSGEVPTSYRYVLFLPQSFGYPATNPAELIEWVGTNTTRQEARFDDTTEEFVTGGFPVPADYDSSGTITIQVIGRSLTAAASKNVAFTFRHLPLADSEAMDAAYTSSASGDSATDATQGDLEVHSWTVGTPGWTAGDWIDFKLSRNPSATNDLTGDWCLRSMILKIPVTG